MPIDYTKRPSAIPTSKAKSPTAAAGPPSAAAVSLSKVRLTKAAPTVSLAKHGGSSGMLHVNLNWDARPPAKGLFKKTQQLDLDLGCLYEFADGTKGVVQALGNTFTARNRKGKQLLRLDGDDRSGQVSGGENLFIDLTDPSAIRRVLEFALIYEGAANWAAANGVATLTPAGAAPIEVLLDDPREGARICAIALISNRNGEIVVQREVNYVNGAQRALDEAYDWGMNWTRGRK
ncbi:MAG: tellurite resistance protein TerA [Pseudonocardiales bacterium]|nr:tellurite resistance protein TerA [Pseudonocardiales bacterium]